MKNLKLTLIVSAMVSVLAGCGGGGGGSDNGIDTSAMTLSITPGGDKNLPANSAIKLSMSSSVRRISATDTNTVANMNWTITPLNGETVNPLLSNASCTGMNISGNSGGCETILSVPQSVTTGKWSVTGTAKASNGTQRSEGFVLSVDNSVYSLNAGVDQIAVQQSNGKFNPVILTGKLTGNNGGKILKVIWNQIAGPDTISISNGDTLTPSFIPTSLGRYTFELQVLIDGATIKAQTNVEAQPK